MNSRYMYQLAAMGITRGGFLVRKFKRKEHSEWVEK